MNAYAITIGTAIALFVIIRLKKTKLEENGWSYPLLLATFPMYYWAFAIYGKDYKALAYEVIVGALFIAIAFISFKIRKKSTAILLATGYILHAIYDVLHDSLYTNSGTPDWWPAFCGIIDVLLGLYLIYRALSGPTTSVDRKS